MKFCMKYTQGEDEFEEGEASPTQDIRAFLHNAIGRVWHINEPTSVGREQSKNLIIRISKGLAAGINPRNEREAIPTQSKIIGLEDAF